MQQILEYSFARVLVRLAGLLLMAWGAFSIVGAVVYVIGLQFDSSGMPLDYMLSYAASTGVPGVVVIAIGAWLTFGGHTVARLLVRGLHGRCRVCGYDVRATPGATCPECNAPIFRETGADRAPEPPTEDLRI